MKTALALASLLVCCTLNATEWFTNLNQAMAEAKRLDKPILIDFTGSDWCPWCIRLDKEVFDTPEFNTWAQGNVVLLKMDFPRNIPQDAATQAANRALMQKLDVQGFPTVVIFNPDGSEKGRTGYRQGGAAAYIRHLEGIIK